MNKKLGLAVAGAVLALSSAAQAGIVIPAGDWTLDISGNVNAYYTQTRQSGDFKNNAGGSVLGGDNASNETSENNITTGLLPNYLAVSGKTRSNDLDVAFTISINPGASTRNSAIQTANQENRQAFLTLGDASWGSVKLGKDLGIYASDAILNDMTLLGVGSGAGILAGNTTTLGRIGTGFMYADWKSQVAYTTPNFNGFQATVGLTQAWNTYAVGVCDSACVSAGGTAATNGAFASATNGSRGGSTPAFEAKGSYSWAGDVSGKVWASFISQRVQNLTQLTSAGGTTGDLGDGRARAWDMGAHIDIGAFGLTAYYGEGRGMGTTVQLRDGFDLQGKARDSRDYYAQATYALPTSTKLGLSYGQSRLDGNDGAGEVDTFKKYSNSMWTVGAYHPITKNLNLVAEYSDVETKIDQTNSTNLSGKSKTVSLGGILFF